MLLGVAVAFWLGWKGVTVAQMRADVAHLLRLPSSPGLAAAAAPGAAFPFGPADRAGSLGAPPPPPVLAGGGPGAGSMPIP